MYVAKAKLKYNFPLSYWYVFQKQFLKVLKKSTGGQSATILHFLALSRDSIINLKRFCMVLLMEFEPFSRFSLFMLFITLRIG